MLKVIHVWPDGFKSVVNFVSHGAAELFVETRLRGKVDDKTFTEKMNEWREKFAIYYDGHMIILIDDELGS